MISRKRNKEAVNNNDEDFETSPTNLTPDTMNTKSEIPNLDEESLAEVKRTKAPKNNNLLQNETTRRKNKRKAPNPSEGGILERKPKTSKPARPDKPPRPNSIMKMAALIKGKRKAPSPPGQTSKEMKYENVAVVKPFDPLAETKESKELENNATGTGAQIQNQPHKPAASETINEFDDSVQSKSKHSANDTVDELNDVTVNNDVEINECSDNDNEMNEPEPNLYENVKSKHGNDDCDTVNEIDFPRQSIMLPDSYPNMSRSRTSVV